MSIDRGVNELRTTIYKYTKFMAQIQPSRTNLREFNELALRSRTSFAALYSQFQALTKILAKNGLTDERKNLEREIADCRILHWKLELHPHGKSLQHDLRDIPKTSAYQQPTKVQNRESAFIEYQDTPPKSARFEPQPVESDRRKDYAFP